MVPPVKPSIVTECEDPAPPPSETEYRFASFLSWYHELRAKRIGIYGTGINARLILESTLFDAAQAILIDDGNAGAELCGKTSVTLEDALQQGIELVVIAAKTRSAQAVFRRISNQCRQCGVSVHDMYGNDLFVISNAFENACSQTLCEQLKELEASDIVAVDIESILSCTASVNVSFALRTGLTVGDCLPRALEHLSAMGKAIVLLSSDTTLSKKDALRSIERISFAQEPRLLLASELGLVAENGLLRILYGLFPNANIVHIARISAESYLAAFLPLIYRRPVVLTGLLPVCPNPCMEVMSGSSEEDGDLAEELLSSCIDSVSQNVEQLCGAQSAPIACIVAQLVIGYVTWLVHMLSENHGFAEVLFASRDAFLVKRVYDIFRQTNPKKLLPPSRYFYTSRKASAEACSGGSDGYAARARYFEYLSSSDLLPGKTYAFCEFVGAGTCQSQLEQFVPFELCGFYFGSRVGDILSRSVRCNCYFDERKERFLSRYLTLEPYFSSSEPSLAGFSEDGRPSCAKELRSSDEIEELERIQDAVCTVAESYFSKWYREGDVINPASLDSRMAELDRCDTSLMELFNDIDGRKLSKNIAENDAAAVRQMKEDLKAKAACAESETNLEHMHRLLLNLLQVFDKLCVDLGLTYIATHGTLLGAVRNGGLIPWDDDIDLAMPRADYDRLIGAVRDGALSIPYYLQTPENDPMNFYGGYAKLRDVSEEAKQFESGWRNPREGIHIDILPLDNCPVEERERMRRRRAVRLWQKLLFAKSNKNDLRFFLDMNPRLVSPIFLLSDCLTHEYLCRRFHAACTAEKPTGLLAIFAGNLRERFDASVFRSDDIEHISRIPFETTEIPVPRNAEEWLERYYGSNWRTALPDDTHSSPFDADNL